VGAEPLELAVRAGLRVAASVEHLPGRFAIRCRRFIALLCESGVFRL